MVTRNIEKSLDLRSVQINHQRTMRPCSGEQIGNQLGRYRNARLVLAVLPRVAIVRNHRRDATCRGALERVHQQKQLHQVLVHAIACGLHHKDIGAANILKDLNVRLAVRKARHRGFAPRQTEKFADLIRERLVGRATEDLELAIILARALRLLLAFRRRLLLLLIRFVSCCRYCRHRIHLVELVCCNERSCWSRTCCSRDTSFPYRSLAKKLWSAAAPSCVSKWPQARAPGSTVV